MSIADKISLLIAASKGSLAELELAKSRIPAECASTVMGPTQTAIASQQQIIYHELINDPDINANAIARFPPDIYQNQNQNQNATISLAGFAFRQVCLDRLRTQSALAGLDLENLPAYAELEAALQGVHEAAQAVEKTWSNVKNNESIGRIHNLKQRSDAKTDMDDAMEELERLMKDRLTLQDALKVEIANQRQDMISSGVALVGVDVRTNKGRIDLYKQQIRVLEEEMHMAEKPSKTAVVDVPARLHEAMKGRQLIVVTNSFADSHRGSLPVGFHIMKRVGSDMHPDHGVMWGTSEYHATGSGTED